MALNGLSYPQNWWKMGLGKQIEWVKKMAPSKAKAAITPGGRASKSVIAKEAAAKSAAKAAAKTTATKAAASKGVQQTLPGLGKAASASKSATAAKAVTAAKAAKISDIGRAAKVVNLKGGATAAKAATVAKAGLSGKIMSGLSGLASGTATGLVAPIAVGLAGAGAIAWENRQINKEHEDYQTKSMANHKTMMEVFKKRKRQAAAKKATEGKTEAAPEKKGEGKGKEK